MWDWLKINCGAAGSVFLSQQQSGSFMDDSEGQQSGFDSTGNMNKQNKSSLFSKDFRKI